MMMVSVLLLSGACAAPLLKNAMPARVVGAWTIEVGPGAVTLPDGEVALAEAVTLEVPPPETVRVTDERHDGLPMFNPKTGGWVRGAKLRGLVTEECTATGELHPDSVRLKASPGDAAPFALGSDYELDPFWATFGRLDGSAIAEGQAVFVDYEYTPWRLDSVLVDETGAVRLAVGEPDAALALPPEPKPGERAVANIWISGAIEQLTDENVFPIEFAPPPLPPQAETQAERRLPKTLAKLRAGKTVTIVAWGDSVTNGGGVNGHVEQWYQAVFAERLRERFPEAAVRMLTAAWPGGNSTGYMKAPSGGTYDFVRDVLEPKPDLVTIEFVNDAYLDEAATAAHYAEILEHLHGIGAEVALITPHLVRRDWLTTDTVKVDEDPRPYVKALRQFAMDNDLALADASKEWCRLWRQGIPYVTLLANSINHPDARGHEIFAEALTNLFGNSGTDPSFVSGSP